MKRTIQGLLIASVLIIGCTSSDTESRPAQPVQNSQLTPVELADIETRLEGICIAMKLHGLPRRPDTREYLREKIRVLASLVTADPELRSTAGSTALESLEKFADAYRGCDPVIADEIRGQLEMVDPE